MTMVHLSVQVLICWHTDITDSDRRHSEKLRAVSLRTLNCFAAVSASATARRVATGDGCTGGAARRAAAAGGVATALAAASSSSDGAVSAKDAAVAVACGGGMRVGPLPCGDDGFAAAAPHELPEAWAPLAAPETTFVLLLATLPLALFCCDVVVVVTLLDDAATAAWPSGLA